MIIYDITETDHCRRVESLLQNILPAAPLSYLRKIIRSGHVTVNDTATNADFIVQLGDRIGLKETGRTRKLLAPQRPRLDILFEDDWIVVIDKEPGIAVHRAAEVDHHNLVELGELMLGSREVLPMRIKLRPVNRLDRGTSGAIVLAKSPTAAGIFGRMVKEEGFGKLYLAIVQGTPPPAGTIEIPLEGKESRTEYRVLFQGNGAAVAAVNPRTGRMHQIRQHFRLAGHPVIGDKRYGGKPLHDYPGIGLHSFVTSFTHPVTNTFHLVPAPLPAGMYGILKDLSDTETTRLIRELPQLIGK
ncbi:RluA family pseudouridine synthase [Geobacter sp. DSM 9736]|uniref:RluA family pseudouridine synthase n=1 Tax=Geobacter sp. DSM 9736 TaxID=1277350 RepID=UPI000B5127FD|nr:RluA family pseudouridine synthase [Geobacter sp. DSM 9736]SNB46033.1 23S rRNA pseudouridine955/2504/2580 synthase [Geobacter sp. DSM 9736]